MPKLQNCEKNHSVCREARAAKGGLPRRLLDIGFKEGDAIRLIESCNLGGGDHKYAIVSHRWCFNKELMFRTLDSNLNDRMRGIPMQGMPAVLKDSIKVARDFGIQYLWIDTVCLIQDNWDDKKKEIMSMGKYYSNACFTIAASSSADTTAPFLTARESYYEPETFSFGEDGASDVRVRIWGLQGHLRRRVRFANINDV